MSIEQSIGVEILCQKDREIFRRQNEEFLASYPTDDAQIDYYTGRAMNLWDEFQIDGSYEVKGTRKNVQTWYENKKKQMELFRKHPYWSEEAKAIIFLQEEERKCSYSIAYKKINQLRAYIYCKVHDMPLGDNILEAIERTLHYISDEPSHVTGVIDDRFIEVFNYRLDGTLPKELARMLKSGTKLTRFVRKCCEKFVMSDGTVMDVTKFEDEHEEGDRNFESFEKHYARFADAISDLKVKKMTIISLNFLDFMTMSNGNSWTSCHYINSKSLFHEDTTGQTYSGGYKQGCLSYALDEPSFIFYTLPNDFSGTDYYRCQKLTRMCSQYSNGILVTGKCYPNNENELITRYRQTMQTVIAELEGVPNRWTYSKNTSRIMGLVETNNGATHYRDYEYERQKPTISLCQKLMIFDIDAPMIIGHEGYCLHCGDVIYKGDRNWLQCDNHRRKMRCSCCGKKITDDMRSRTLYGNLYCEDCTFYCAVHEQWEPKDTLHGTITMSGGIAQVCKDAMQRLELCVDCGVYERRSRMYKTTGGYFCKKHVRKYKKCYVCGMYVLNKDAHATEDGNHMCSSCNALTAGGRIRIVKKYRYEPGDYVVMADADQISRCDYGVNDTMRTHYPNRITRIVEHTCYDIRVQNLCESDPHEAETPGRWSWSSNCIAYGIIGVNESHIGKTLAEIGMEEEEE